MGRVGGRLVTSGGGVASSIRSTSSGEGVASCTKAMSASICRSWRHCGTPGVGRHRIEGRENRKEGLEKWLSASARAWARVLQGGSRSQVTTCAWGTARRKGVTG